MQQILAVWAGLDMRRRVIAVAATLAVFAAVLGLSRMAAAPNLSLLYAGLEPGAAGEVVQALEAQGIAHEVRGDGIYVDSAARDSLRLTLASQGLPANGAQGYELLDGLSGFGTTAQMFDAAYWRAKEGELARTIVASPGIRFARVHIANQTSQPFRRTADPTASVTVTGTAGPVSPVQAKALKYLVASAVAGLQPAAVSVIDTEAGVIASGEEDDAAAPDTRAEMLRQNVQRLLEARVGPGRAVVEVSVETMTDQESIFERRIDPETRVPVTTDSAETSSSETETGGDGVTVASNLPDGDAARGGGQSQSQNSETRERIEFEMSETTREIVREPGAIRRITVAVLVDGVETPGPDGAPVWAPRPDDEMTALRDLVASAVGYDEARGDVITIRSLRLETPLPAGTEARAGLFAALALDAMSLLQLAALAIVALVLGLFVVRPILTAPPPALAPPQPASAAEAAADGAEVLSGEVQDGDYDGPDIPAIGGDLDLPALPDIQLPIDPATRLRQLIEERQEDTIEILRSWMEDQEEERA